MTCFLPKSIWYILDQIQSVWSSDERLMTSRSGRSHALNYLKAAGVLAQRPPSNQSSVFRSHSRCSEPQRIERDVSPRRRQSAAGSSPEASWRREELVGLRGQNTIQLISRSVCAATKRLLVWPWGPSQTLTSTTVVKCRRDKSFADLSFVGKNKNQSVKLVWKLTMPINQTNAFNHWSGIYSLPLQSEDKWCPHWVRLQGRWQSISRLIFPPLKVLPGNLICS